VNDAEAKTVRHIFRRYCASGSVRELQRELEVGKIVGKARISSSGQHYGGKPFSRGALYHLLQNKIYIGLTTHRGEAYAGEHEGIVGQDLWEATQNLLTKHRVSRRAIEEQSSKKLAGIIFDVSGEAMTSSHATKHGVRYRYYISRSLTKNCKTEHPDAQRIPATLLEELVITRIKDFLSDPKQVLDALPKIFQVATFQLHLNKGLQDLSSKIEQNSTTCWSEMILQFLKRVQVHRDQVEIALDGYELVRTIFGDRATSVADEDDPSGATIKLSMYATLKRTGKELKFIAPSATINATADQSLIKLLVRARALQTAIESSGSASIEEIASSQNLTSSYVARLVRLNFLAPDIVEAIFAGRQPPELSANKLMKDTRFPLSWYEQRHALGFTQA